MKKQHKIPLICFSLQNLYEGYADSDTSPWMYMGLWTTFIAWHGVPVPVCGA